MEDSEFYIPSSSCWMNYNVCCLLMCPLSPPPCSQLFQANHSVFGSSQGSSTEDLFTDSIDSCDLDITEKVRTHADRFGASSGSLCLKSNLPSGSPAKKQQCQCHRRTPFWWISWMSGLNHIDLIPCQCSVLVRTVQRTEVSVTLLQS